MKSAIGLASIAASTLVLTFSLIAESTASENTADAGKVICRVEIQVGVAYAPHTIEEVFDASIDDGQRVMFQVPGRDYTCWLAWFTNKGGTSLSCQFDDTGIRFAQSDRTALDEYPAFNNLRFSDDGVVVHIESECKRQGKDAHSVE